MNRYQTPDLAVTPPRIDQRETPESALLTATPPGHCVFAPLHYERKYAYPLLIWLHAEGMNENHLKQIMPRISMRNYVAVGPRGTAEVPAGSDSQEDGRFTWCQSEDHIFLASQRVTAAVEHAQQRLNVHDGRIFLAGAGNGGTMAFRIAMRYPETFAGVISLGGAFPAGHAPLVRLADARRLPLFIGSGRESRTYSESSLCRDLRLIHSAGMMLTIRQYPGSSDISSLILTDVDRWIMEVISNDRQSAVVTA